MVQHTMDAFKTIDIVINSAGLLLTGGIEETSDELMIK